MKCRLHKRPQQDRWVAVHEGCVFYVELGYCDIGTNKEGRKLTFVNYLNGFFWNKCLCEFFIEPKTGDTKKRKTECLY